jgi:hypothetical protein
MSEPELPGIPPPPTPAWYQRLRSRLFGRWKWPGWVGFLYLVLTEVPDWHHRFDFWLSTGETMGGYVGNAAAVVSSPYFRWILFGATIAYLAVVEEPRRGLRYHWLPYLGWFVVAASILMFLFAAGYGYFEIRVREVASERFGPWTLSASQKKGLDRSLMRKKIVCSSPYIA